MSTTKRIISGSIASWVKILVTIITQVLLVPIFLTYWDVKIYGIWIGLHALVSILSTLDRGFNDYMQYDFLKIGPKRISKISYVLWSSVSVVMLTSLLEFMLIGVLLVILNLSFLNDKSLIILSLEIKQAFFLLWISWALNNLAGLFFRCLCVFGYYPRMSWWNVIYSIFTSIAPIYSIMNGGTLVSASYYTLIGSVLILLIQYIDITLLLKKNNILKVRSSFKYGFHKYFISLGLSSRYFLENFRQQGIRILLAPLLGASGLAAFATTRTFNNVALQGLGTIVNPILPELMRFLHQKEQKKMEASFDTIWLILVALMTFGMIFLQAFAHLLFDIWTKGLITFNPYLFASLSLSVLVYAWGQPAASIVIGNNLIRHQFVISFIAFLILSIGIYLFIPIWGILGSGVALLFSEFFVAFGYLFIAKNWLYAKNLIWPARSSFLSFISILVSGFGMLLLILFPQFKWIMLSIGCILQFFILKLYWANMPEIALIKAKELYSRFSSIVSNNR